MLTASKAKADKLASWPHSKSKGSHAFAKAELCAKIGLCIDQATASRPPTACCKPAVEVEQAQVSSEATSKDHAGCASLPPKITASTKVKQKAQHPAANDASEDAASRGQSG